MKNMHVTVEKVFPSEAHAKLLSSWNKQFSVEYDGPTKSGGFNSKTRIALALKDIKEGSALFIKLNGKKIGMVISPLITDNDDNVKGRFLDTRWIEPKYRGLGIGSKVMKILIEQYDIAGTNLIGHTLFNDNIIESLLANGFQYAQPKFYVDEYFKAEKEVFESGRPDYCHFFVYRTNGLYKEILKDKDMPVIDLKHILQKAKLKRAA